TLRAGGGLWGPVTHPGHTSLVPVWQGPLGGSLREPGGLAYKPPSESGHLLRVRGDGRACEKCPPETPKSKPGAEAICDFPLNHAQRCTPAIPALGGSGWKITSSRPASATLQHPV
ncbi:hypothetical protein H1C71_012058, partial [Ictidomys tridecemlineatus]